MISNRITSKSNLVILNASALLATGFDSQRRQSTIETKMAPPPKSKNKVVKTPSVERAEEKSDNKSSPSLLPSTNANEAKKGVEENDANIPVVNDIVVSNSCIYQLSYLYLPKDL